MRIWKEIPGNAGERIVLLHYDGEPQTFRNLLKLGPGQEVIWMVEPRHPLEGIYTDVSFDGAVVSAYCWSGFRDIIDYRTGKVTDRTFAK